MYLLAEVSSEEAAKITKQAVKSTLDLVQDKMGQVFLWSAVAMAGLFLLGTAVIYFARRDKLSDYLKHSLLFGVGFALALAVSGLAVTLIKYDVRGSLTPTILYPMIATVAAAVAGGFALFVVNMVAKDKFKLALWIVGALVAVPAIVALVYMGIYYANNVQGDGYYDGGYGKVSTGALIGSVAGLVVLAILVVIFFGRKGDKREHAKSIAYAGVSIALAFALSYVKIFRLPQGGSVTLASMLPIMLYSFRYGTRKGLLVGLVYGAMQALQDPYIIHPAQFLLDYPVAFAMLGLAGWVFEIKWFGKHQAVGLLVGGISAFFLRYISHVLSGIFAFSAYALDAGYDSATIYSFLYNTYVLVDGALCVALGALIFANRGARKVLLVTSHLKHPEVEATQEEAPAEEAAPVLEGVEAQSEPTLPPQDEPTDKVDD